MKKSILVLDILILLTTLIGFGALGALVLTAGQAAPSISIGQATSTISGSSGTISIPISIKNPGPLSMDSISLNVLVLDQNGTQLFQGGGGPTSLAPGSSSRFPVKISFDLNNIPRPALQRLLTTSENLTIDAGLEGSLPPLATLNGVVTTNLPWGAPVNDLSVGTPQATPANSSSSSFIQVSVPVSFSNTNQFIDISTTLNAQILNASSGSAIGSGQIAVNAPHGTAFSGNLVTYVVLDKLPMNTLLFNDSVLNLNAILSGSYSGAPINFEKSFSIDWGAPIHNLEFGSFSAEPYNATAGSFILPFNFTNDSQYIGLNANVSGAVLDSSGNQVGTVNNTVINAGKGSFYSGQLQGSIELPSLVGHSALILQLTFNTAFGSFVKEVVVNG